MTFIIVRAEPEITLMRAGENMTGSDIMIRVKKNGQVSLTQPIAGTSITVNSLNALIELLKEAAIVAEREFSDAG